MKRNVSLVCVYSRCNVLISGKIIKEMPGSVASGTHCIMSDYDHISLNGSLQFTIIHFTQLPDGIGTF